MHFNYIDLIGFVGASLFLFAFFKTSTGRWKGTSFWYELSNLVGATFMGIYALSKSAYVFILLNTVWALVAFWGVCSYIKKRINKTKQIKKSLKNKKRAN